MYNILKTFQFFPYICTICLQNILFQGILEWDRTMVFCFIFYVVIILDMILTFKKMQSLNVYISKRYSGILIHVFLQLKAKDCNYLHSEFLDWLKDEKQRLLLNYSKANFQG